MRPKDYESAGSEWNLQSNGTPRISVMVVDNQALFRSGLVRLLQDDERLEVVAESTGDHKSSTSA